MLVGWDPLFVDNKNEQKNYYELFWRQHPNGESWTRLVATTRPNYPIKYFGEDEIDIKVRGVSPCSSGKFSMVHKLRFIRK